MGRKIAIVSLSILLLAICAGTIIASVPVIDAIRSGRVHFGWLSLNNVAADVVEEKKADIGEAGLLTVNTPNGKIEIKARGDIHEVTITAHKSAWGMDTKTAEDLLQKVIVVVEQTEGRVDIRVDSPVTVDLLHIGPSGVEVDFDILVPTGTRVEASTSAGIVRLDGITGDAVLRSEFGDVYGTNLGGALTAHTASGAIIVTDSGSLQGVLDVSSDFGDVSLTRVKASALTAETNSGQVTLTEAEVAGGAALNSEFGDVRMRSVKAGSVRLDTNSGAVSLEEVSARGAAVAKSDFGDILCFKTLAASYDLRTSSGKVEADSLQGTAVVHSNLGDLVLSGTDVLMEAGTSSGSVTYRGSLAEGVNAFQSNFGSITIYLPEDAQFHMELRTDFGNVSSDFPVTTTGAGATRLSGDVGSSAVSLKASTNSGDVKVSILTGASGAAN
jgi:DUF4097 and DUF4098 domain-containing protein YvlB